jgi:hypothetical protein
MIRKATEGDIPFIVETGMRLHARSGNEDVPVHKPTVFSVMHHFVRAHDKFFVVSEHEEIIRGFLMAIIQPFWWDDPARGRRFVTDWAFYSEIKGDGLLMLKALQEWAWMQPRVVEVCCATNVPKGRHVVDQLFDHAGFERRGGMYRTRKPETMNG